MPEPAAVPESTELKTVHPDIYASPVYLAGLLERIRRTKDVERLFAAEIEEMHTRTPAASPVAGVSEVELLAVAIVDIAIAAGITKGELPMTGSEVLTLAKEIEHFVAQPSAEGDDASGIVPYLVGQIAALGPNPAGSRTNELFALLHEAIDSLRAEGDGWIAVTPETKVQEFYIVTTAHKALWPRGVLLFWAEGRSGYSTFLEKAGRYSEEEARAICRMRGGADFMVPCEVIEAEAVRVVDVDKLQQVKTPAPPVAKEGRES